MVLTYMNVQLDQEMSCLLSGTQCISTVEGIDIELELTVIDSFI